MKKMLYSTFVALIAISMSASPVKTASRVPSRLPGVPMESNAVYDPAGGETDYIMNVTETDYFGESQCDGYKMHVRTSDDGEVYWFRDLAPGYGGDGASVPYSWVKGMREGDEVIVKAGQMIYDVPANDQVLYLEAVTVDEYGMVAGFLDEVRFSVSGDRITQTDPSVYLAVYEDGETMEDAGIYLFLNGYDMEPVGELPTFAPSADVPVEQWLLRSDQGSRFVKAAVDGDNVYVAGLSEMAPDDFIPGRMEDGVVTFKSGYILTSNPRWYVCLMGGLEGEPDEWGWPSIELTLDMRFAVDDESGVWTLSPENACILETNYFKTSYFSLLSGVSMRKYEGDAPAVPANPSVIDYDAFNRMLMIDVPTEDVQGEYINPEHLSYALMMDGELYEFTPADYIALTEPKIFLPYGFSDGWDIYFNGWMHSIFLQGETEWDELEVVSRYEVDGIVNYSPNWTACINALQDSPESPSAIYHDMNGRRIDNPAAKGVYIKTTITPEGRHIEKIMK